MALYGFAVALFAIAVAFSASIGYTKGSASRNPEIAELSAAIKASEVIAREAEKRAAETAARVVTVYKDRIKVIREVQPAEIQLVEVIKSEATCMAPPPWRLLHDSAATGSPIPEGSARVDAAPVPLEEAAAVVAENYRVARENAARLESIQTLIRESVGNDHSKN